MIFLILPDIADEDRLLARAHRGQQDALREIYVNYYTPIYQFIRMRTEDADTAEDLAADVFVQLVNAFRQGKGPRHTLRGWLFRVARHRLYDHYHTHPGFTETVLDEWLSIPVDDQPEAQFTHSMHMESARLAVRQLTVEQQEVLILRFGNMLSLEETAEIMGKKANAVKQLQLRALGALRRVLHEMEASYD
jgi:RNA polymerase sigma-70 factor (ECF subfamily)